MTDIISSSQPAWAIPGYLEIRDNRLRINGVDAVELAKEFDTPLFVVSAPRIRHNIARLLEAASHHKKIKLCYASKANNTLGVLRVVRDAGIDVEVNSGGELFRALRAGVGLHIHVGSQTPDPEPYVEALAAMWDHLLWLHRETGHKLQHINIGGGIPVNYLRDDMHAEEIGDAERDMLGADLTSAEMMEAAIEAVRSSAREAGAEYLLDDLEIVMEPGRAVIADAVTILTKVRNVKYRPETGENWALTDAGYNLMLSMVMYHWYYHAIDASRAAEPPVSRYRMAGPLCDGGDVYFDLHGEGRLPDCRLLPANVEVGERIAN